MFSNTLTSNSIYALVASLWPVTLIVDVPLLIADITPSLILATLELFDSYNINYLYTTNKRALDAGIQGYKSLFDDNKNLVSNWQDLLKQYKFDSKYGPWHTYQKDD